MVRDDKIARQPKIPSQIVQSWSTDTDDEEEEVVRQQQQQQQQQQPEIQQSVQNDCNGVISLNNENNKQSNKRNVVTTFNDYKNFKKYKKESIQENDLFIGAYKTCDELPSYDEIEANLLAFCCQRSCTCSDDRKSQIDDERGPYITACGENSLWHRRCCHGAFKFSTDWKSDFEKVQQSMLDDLEDIDKVYYNDTIFLDTVEDVKKKFFNAKRQEAKFRNEDTLAGKKRKITKMNSIVFTSNSNNVFGFFIFFVQCI
jgi:hypothetical protein